ncbi:MAG: glycosyltransferase family 4 protein, partial [Calditrichaceae bacterium]
MKRLSSEKTEKLIVFLVPGFPEDEKDTSCIPALQNYILHFSQTHPGLRTIVIAFQYPFIRGWYYRNHISVYSCGGKNKGGIFRLMVWVRAAAVLIRIRAGIKISVIHSFWLSETTLIGQWLAGILGAAHVASVMGQDALESNPYLRRLNFSKMTMTCGSQTAARHFFESTGRTTDHIIPIGIDRDMPEFSRNHHQRDIDIIGVGSLIPLKNFRLFIEIISELRPEFPNIRCVIIGDGTERDQLAEMITGLDLDENIRLTGHLTRAEVISLLTQSRIFLHTSEYEAQGYVFLEALFAGLYLVKHDTGYPESGHKTVICKNKGNFLEAISSLMRTAPDHSPILLKTINETVNDYHEIYFGPSVANRTKG